LLTFVGVRCCFGETASWGFGGELVEMDGSLMIQLFVATLDSSGEWLISDMLIIILAGWKSVLQWELRYLSFWGGVSILEGFEMNVVDHTY
jgi:hypothetical protein